MLPIQNSSPAFGGKFVRNEILEKRINEVTAPAKLNRMYEALKQMDSKKDGKLYKYAEETIEYDTFLDVVEDTVGYIANEKGKRLKEMVVDSKGLYSDGYAKSNPKSISDFICDFAKEHYPKKINEEKVRKNIFDLLA